MLQGSGCSSFRKSHRLHLKRLGHDWCYTAQRMCVMIMHIIQTGDAYEYEAKRVGEEERERYVLLPSRTVLSCSLALSSSRSLIAFSHSLALSVSLSPLVFSYFRIRIHTYYINKYSYTLIFINIYTYISMRILRRCTAPFGCLCVYK